MTSKQLAAAAVCCLITTAAPCLTAAAPGGVVMTPHHFEKCPALATGTAMPFRLGHNHRTRPWKKIKRSCWLGGSPARVNRPSTGGHPGEPSSP